MGDGQHGAMADRWQCAQYEQAAQAVASLVDAGPTGRICRPRLYWPGTSPSQAAAPHRQVCLLPIMAQRAGGVVAPTHELSDELFG